MQVIGYTRVSSEEQMTGYSTDAQVEAIKRWAEAEGHQVVSIYIEPGLSAKSDNRPMFQEAVKAVLSGQAEALVVHKFDRFARNVLDSRLYKQMLRANGNDIISVTEPIDPTPSGQLMEGVLELFAEYYIVNLGAEVRKGQLAAARAGNWPGRNAPAGYRRVRQGKSSWIEVSKMGPMITQAFNEFATGNYTLEGWADEAYARGYRGQRSGKRIAPSVWGKIFRNEFYIGVIVWGGQRFQGQHEPLVDHGTFRAVQAVLDGRGGQDRKRQRHRYLLKGLLFSTVHQTTMTGNTVKNRHGKRYCYYRSVKRNFSEHNVPCYKVENDVAQLLHQIIVVDASDFPDNLQLALTVAPSVGAVYEALTTFEARRQLLELVFPPGSIRVGRDGLEGVTMNEGFDWNRLGIKDANLLIVRRYMCQIGLDTGIAPG